MFNYSIDSSLPRISMGVVKLFFYLSVKSLDLRKIGKLFSQGKAKYKTMVRKLYTVATGLELAGIIQKTSVVSEIQLLIPLHVTEIPCTMSISFFLNTRKDIDERTIIEQRRKEFEAVGMMPTQPGMIDPHLRMRQRFKSMYP
jgi:hypothetical protein